MEQELLGQQIQLQKKLVRQLRLLNVWISIFGIVVSVILVVFVFFIYKGITYIHNASNSITSIQNKANSTLDLQQQLCKDNSALSAVVKDQTSICNK